MQLDEASLLKEIQHPPPFHIEDNAILLARAGALQAAGDLLAAKAVLERLLAQDGNLTEALSRLGLIHTLLGNFEQAVLLLKASLRVDPSQAPIHNALGVACRRLERLEEALGHFETAAALGLDEAVMNRANMLRLLCRYDEAVAAFRRAERLAPYNPYLFCNQAPVHIYRRDYATALHCLNRAISLDPDFAEAHHSRAELLLLMGRFQEGWRDYEWRWKMGQATSILPDFGCPLWLGDDDLRGKTILLWAEQGFGDKLQFARFVPQVADIAGKVIVLVQDPLVTLLASVDPRVETRSLRLPIPAADYYCPFMSLPLALGTTPDTIPLQFPYLHPTQDAVARWRALLGPRTRKRVGLVWYGSMRGTGAVMKSMAFEDILPLVDVNADFYSIQKHADSESAKYQQHERITDMTALLTDFNETAALMEELDLVVTVDTATAHLAGALGRPFWLLLHHMPEWRWTDNESSPWYPTVRLFRQTVPLDWSAPIQEVRDSLTVWARS